MRRLMLAAIAAVGAVCAQADAAVYTFNPTSIGPVSSPFYTTDAAAFTISISDATVQSGSFSYDYRARYDPSVNPPQGAFVSSAVGNVQALQLFRARDGLISFGAGQGPTGTASDFFTTNLQFSPNGQISAGSLTFSDDSFFINLTGSGGLFVGTFAIGSTIGTSVTGRFTGALPVTTDVPEPASLALLAACAAFVGMKRRCFR